MAQMVYELCMLISIFVNVLDRPRASSVRLIYLLRRDGVVYFAVRLSIITHAIQILMYDEARYRLAHK